MGTTLGKGNAAPISLVNLFVKSLVLMLEVTIGESVNHFRITFESL